jgi:leucyl-tRNA synthetase
MKKYQVGIKIYNTFEVEANSEEEAEEKVRELDVYKTLDDCDYNITYVDEVKGRDIPREMCEDLLAKARGGFPTGSVDFGTSME